MNNAGVDKILKPQIKKKQVYYVFLPRSVVKVGNLIHPSFDMDEPTDLIFTWPSWLN